MVGEHRGADLVERTCRLRQGLPDRIGIKHQDRKTGSGGRYTDADHPVAVGLEDRGIGLNGLLPSGVTVTTIG